MRRSQTTLRSILTILLAGCLTWLVCMGFAVQAAWAAPGPNPAAQAEATPSAEPTPLSKACAECHPDKATAWKDSPHAHAFDHETFQAGWQSMENDGDCLLCHPASYDAVTGSYTNAGVTCEACHGPGNSNHPPEDILPRSDEEYCGNCHPATVGEAHLSGHSAENDVRCASCHDPHNGQVLLAEPDDLCKDCHKEDLEQMDERLSGIHLQEDVSCVDCHTLDVPHTFLFNFKHEDTQPFFTGSDCAVEIEASESRRAGIDQEEPGEAVQNQMSWPLVHRVSQPEATLQCSDCHVMDEALRADFIALGYSPEVVDEFSWDNADFPALTESDLTKLVATPRISLGWLYWLVGLAAIFAVFELSVTRKMAGAPQAARKPFFQRFRRRSARQEAKSPEDGQAEEK